ncbi:MAG: spore coat U domain-containing protein [Terracidiphilus sp.]|jgi:spore coat protein U-like protein
MKLTNAIKSALPVAVLGFLVLGLTSTPAVATTATATIAVSASVVATCSISANALGFGAYTGVVINATTTVSVYCTNTTPYNVGLDAGLSGGTVTTRAMKSGANKLNYSLTQDLAGLTNWGNTTGSWVGGTGSGSAQSITVYGQVPALQTLTIGTYTDTITATVNY